MVGIRSAATRFISLPFFYSIFIHLTQYHIRLYRNLLKLQRLVTQYTKTALLENDVKWINN